MTILNSFTRPVRMLLCLLTLSLTPSIASSATANVYVYEDADGNHVITSQKTRNKNLRLIKTYKARRSTPKRKSNLHGKRNKASKRKRCNQKSMNQRATPHKRSIEVYSRIYGVEKELVIAIIQNESCFRTTAKSHVGAIGLMQLMPGTAKQMKISDPWDPDQNIQGGVKYIAEMLRLFKGNKQYAVAAYNAGPGRVYQYNGIPPYKETRNYVKNVLEDYNSLKVSAL